MNKKGSIFIAGTGKDAGKTTISMGLVSYFKEKFPDQVSFIKPLGQKTSVINGVGVGQDSLLLQNALNLNTPSELSAPFSTGSGAAERFIISGEPKNLKGKIVKAYKKLYSNSKIVVVEGTGHPGVGSVFNLSNAKVASLYKTPVILILSGGVGSTIDRFNLSIAPFQKENVELLGVIINKILPSKMEKVTSILSKWFEERGIPVFGFIPYDDSISAPSLGVLSKELGMETIFLNNDKELSSISGFIYAFGSRDEVLKELDGVSGKALLVSKRRNDIIDTIIARKLSGVADGSPEALILCGEGSIDNWIKAGCEKAGLPLFETNKSFDKTSRKLHMKVFKVEPEESEKIGKILRLVKESVDIEMINNLLFNHGNEEKNSKDNIFRSLITRSLGVIGNLLKKR